jgi:hypothetical protein
LHRARQRLAKLLEADDVMPALHLLENKP